MSEIERRLVLTMLVQRWSQTHAPRTGDAAHLGDHAAAAGANTPAQAAHLAAELARLMDMVETENVPLDGLAGAGAGGVSPSTGRRRIEFLEIITGLLAGVPRREGLAVAVGAAQPRHPRRSRAPGAAPPAGPVIVAGVTGSIPATVELMRAVARLPQGAIVLPGLDLHLDEESWATIAEHPEHPQFGFAKLLDRLGLERERRAHCRATRSAPNVPGGEALIAEAMRPSGTTGRWQHTSPAADAGAVERARTA